VQSAIDNRVVDAHFLIWVAGGRALCTAAMHVLSYASAKVTTSLNARSRQLYSGRIFHAMARLDVPTWDDPAVSSQIEALRPRMPDTEGVAWGAIMTLVETGSAFLRMFSEAAVLFRVLQEHGDGSLLVLVSLAGEAVSLFAFRGGPDLGNGMREIPSSVPP
jgi:putative Ca2+/H+ antiporter (TMEM165/GDT1 family)